MRPKYFLSSLLICIRMLYSSLYLALWRCYSALSFTLMALFDQKAG